VATDLYSELQHLLEDEIVGIQSKPLRNYDLRTVTDFLYFIALPLFGQESAEFRFVV
jgi:hypothetical protein